MIDSGLIIGRISVLVLLTSVYLSKVYMRSPFTHDGVVCQAHGTDLRIHGSLVKRIHMLLDSAQVKVAIIRLRRRWWLLLYSSRCTTHDEESKGEQDE